MAQMACGRRAGLTQGSLEAEFADGVGGGAAGGDVGGEEGELRAGGDGVGSGSAVYGHGIRGDGGDAVGGGVKVVEVNGGVVEVVQKWRAFFPSGAATLDHRFGADEDAIQDRAGKGVSNCLKWQEKSWDFLRGG